MIIASGDQWSIVKKDDRSFSIMEHAGTVLSAIVDISIFFWYGELCGS